MSNLDSALIEIRHMQLSLKQAIKQEADPYQCKYYTSLVGHCAFAEHYIKQEVERGKTTDTKGTDEGVGDKERQVPASS